MTRRRLDDERAPEDYAGDQPQGPGPDNDDRIPRRIRRGEGPAPTVAADPAVTTSGGCSRALPPRRG
jgi:hypothetical protein